MRIYEKDILVILNPFFFVYVDMIDYFIRNKNMTNKNIYEVIIRCQEPQYINILTKKFNIPFDTIDFLLGLKVIIPIEQSWTQGFYTTLDIEICTHCNYRCDYCPVKISPKKPQLMDNKLFAEIIDKANNFPSITTINLNAYNEPLLDPELLDKLNIVSKTKLKIILNTNGSLLNPDKFDAIIKCNAVKTIHINIPSLDEQIYQKKTGTRNFFKTINNINYIIKTKRDVEINLVVLDKNIDKSIKKFYRYYKNNSNVNIIPGIINDRAGLLEGEYSQRLQINDKLVGCNRFINYLSVSVNGDFFICCQDYFQREIFGNIRDGTIENIINGEKSIGLKKKVFGEMESSPDFICRKCDKMRLGQLKVRANKYQILKKQEPDSQNLNTGYSMNLRF